MTNTKKTFRCITKTLFVISALFCLYTPPSYANNQTPSSYYGDTLTQKDKDTFALLAQAKNIIDNSLYTFQNIMARQDRPTIIELMKRTKGVVIFPHVYSGGFILGGSGGVGVLLARAPDGQWSYPAFYNIASASFGLQVGAQSSKTVFLLMSDKALGSVMHNSFTFGGSMGLSLGTIGSSIGGSTTTNAGADVMMFSLTNAGLFAGIKLQSASINPNLDLNHVFYPAESTAEDIVLNGRYGNPAADDLRHALENYTMPAKSTAATQASPYDLTPTIKPQNHATPSTNTTTQTTTILPPQPTTTTQPPLSPEITPAQSPTTPTVPTIPQTTTSPVKAPEQPHLPMIQATQPTNVPAAPPMILTPPTSSQTPPTYSNDSKTINNQTATSTQSLPQQTIINP